MKKLNQIYRVVFVFAFMVLSLVFGDSKVQAEIAPSYDYVEDESALIINDNSGFQAFRDEQISQIGIVKHVLIKSGVTVIANHAFVGCMALETVRISGTVTEIGERAFEGCQKLTGVKIPNSVIDIGQYAFSGSGLTSIVIPDSVQGLRRLGTGAFSMCSNLISVTLQGKSFADDGTGVFSKCEKLSSVTIPMGVREIPAGTFEECKSLTQIALPEGLERIHHNAFSSSGLTEITIPSSVKNILGGAFSKNTNLSVVRMKSTVPCWLDPRVFEGLPADYKIYVPFLPKGTVDTYKARDCWSEYKDRITHEHVVSGWIIDTPATSV